MWLFLAVNIALNKPAYQRRGWHGNDAQNAVDGRKSNQTGKGGECTMTYGEQNATWWVDLTSIHRVHYITIYYMIFYGNWGTAYTSFFLKHIFFCIKEFFMKLSSQYNISQ